MVTIENELLSVKISEKGAELRSVVRKDNGRECLWQGDKEYWSGQAPLLFPSIGNLHNGCMRMDGQVYQMPKHGFVRNSVFEVEVNEPNRVTLTTSDNEENLKSYPRPFRLSVTYTLQGPTLSVTWAVTNTGIKAMPFQIGAHPAFNIPDWNADEDVHGYLTFNIKDKLVGDYLTKNGLRARGKDAAISLTPMHEEAAKAGDKVATFDVPLTDGRLALTNTTFLCDTIVDARRLVDTATLHDKNGNQLISVRFNMPYLAIWAPKGGKSPFVCIEPWCGCCDIQDYDGMYADRDIINSLLPSETFSNTYHIDVWR